MSAKVDISVVGVKDTINKLRKLDPELQKQFKADATAIAQPAINAAKAMYTQVPLSGMSRDWKQKKDGRKIKGFDVARAKAGVQMKFDTRRNAVGVILIIQKDVKRLYSIGMTPEEIVSGFLNASASTRFSPAPFLSPLFGAFLY